MKRTYILTHNANGQELYEPRALLITPEHAENLRTEGMTLHEEEEEGREQHA